MKLLNAAILAGAFVTLAAGANATPLISIGLEETGVNGGAITTEASSSTLSAGYYSTIFTGSYGTFSLNSLTGSATVAPGTLDSTSLNASSTTAGTIDIFVTIQGVTSPTGVTNWLNGFTSNLLPTGWTLAESTYVDPGNGLYAETTSIAAKTFTSIGTDNIIAGAAVGSGPYSLTEEYVLTSIGAGEALSTVSVAAVVPEPGTLAILGAGLVGLGFIRRRGISFRL